MYIFPNPGAVGGLQFIQIVVQWWNSFFKPLTFPDFLDHKCGSAALLEGISWQDLPMVKHTLREGLASGVGTQISSES